MAFPTADGHVIFFMKWTSNVIKLQDKMLHVEMGIFNNSHNI